MKYIRTKDRVYNLDWLHSKGFSDDGNLILSAINQADTIEELCDEFVLCENNKCCIISDVEAKEMSRNKCKIYGAIWTDKGLIYVAKMNDKGELKLL